MLLFSDYLKELLSERDTSISSLAKECNLERTLLSRVLSGQRALPFSALDSVIYHLKLTPGEEKRLRGYYEQQFEKEGIRTSRSLIGRMFADLSTLNFHMPVFTAHWFQGNLEQFVGSHCVFRGETNVRLLLQMVIAAEADRADAFCCLTIPMVSSHMGGNIDLLSLFVKKDQSIMDVEHILCFDAGSRTEEISAYNLDYFCRILPVSLLSGENYHPYYYYGNIFESICANPYPWFLVTHSFVLCLSEKGDSAMLLRDSEQIAWYHKFFSHLKTRCRSLIRYTGDPLVILDAYQACTDEDGSCVIMDQPCFARYYTEDLARKYLRKELDGYEEILHAALEHFSHLQRASQFYTVFSETGLRRFMAEGTLDDSLARIAGPFDRNDRVRLVRRLAADIRSGVVRGRVIPENLFPDYLSMRTTANRGCGFFATQKFAKEDGACAIQIVEPGLCRAFHSWLLKLADSRQTMTAGETADLLESVAAENSEAFSVNFSKK